MPSHLQTHHATCVQTKELTQSIQKSHVEQYSAVKNLDFVCLIDVTGSMCSYINGVRENIQAVLAQISER